MCAYRVGIPITHARARARPRGTRPPRPKRPSAERPSALAWHGVCVHYVRTRAHPRTHARTWTGPTHPPLPRPLVGDNRCRRSIRSLTCRVDARFAEGGYCHLCLPRSCASMGLYAAPTPTSALAHTAATHSFDHRTPCGKAAPSVPTTACPAPTPCPTAPATPGAHHPPPTTSAARLPASDTPSWYSPPPTPLHTPPVTFAPLQSRVLSHPSPATTPSLPHPGHKCKEVAREMQAKLQTRRKEFARARGIIPAGTPKRGDGE